MAAKKVLLASPSEAVRGMSADELVKHSVKGKAQQMDAALELLRRKSNRIARRSAA